MENSTFTNARIEGNKIKFDHISSTYTRTISLNVEALYDMFISIDTEMFANAITGLLFAYARQASFILNNEYHHDSKELLGAEDNNLYFLKLLHEWLQKIESEHTKT